MIDVAPLRALWRIRRLIRASNKAADRGQERQACDLLLRAGVEWAALEWRKEQALPVRQG